MRRLTVVALLALGACKHQAAAPAAATAAATPAVPLVSVLNMSDPQAATQLTRGFWSLENGAWRWTASKFAVTLRPPASSAQNGARLDMKITLPEAVFKNLVPMTLSAKVGGDALEPQKYTKAGDYLFTRDVPSKDLSGDQVLIEFATDKAQAPGVDRRELALIVSRVELVAKRKGAVPLMSRNPGVPHVNHVGPHGDH